MRTGIVVDVTAAERDRLKAIVADRNSPQIHVWRAGIVLATADGPGTVAIMHHTSAIRASRPPRCDEPRFLRVPFVSLVSSERGCIFTRSTH